MTVINCVFGENEEGFERLQGEACSPAGTLRSWKWEILKGMHLNSTCLHLHGTPRGFTKPLIHLHTHTSDLAHGHFDM